MNQVTIVGCDLHDRSMLLRYALAGEKPLQKSFAGDTQGRATMREFLVRFASEHHSGRIVFVYEASGQGYGLHDFLSEAGIECFVLPPSRLPKSAKRQRQKTDAHDAQYLLELARAHVLAGNHLPSVWTPPPALRDDRELVRARIESAEAGTAVKLQILSLLKRYGRELPAIFRKNHNWTQKFSRWAIAEVAQLPPTVQSVLECLLQRLQELQKAIALLEKKIEELSQSARYQAPCAALRQLTGVGLMTAMTFLTEMGDLTRFANRRQVAAYLGLCPASFESGAANDRKGHITRQGPSRLRKMLCQAAWTAIRRDEGTRAKHQRISQERKGQRKKAAVAVMRQLAIRMWHVALAAGVSPDLVSPPIPPPRWCTTVPDAIAQAG